MTALLIILILVYLFIGLFWAVIGYMEVIKRKDSEYHELVNLSFLGHLYVFVRVGIGWGPSLIRYLRRKMQ